MFKDLLQPDLALLLFSLLVFPAFNLQMKQMESTVFQKLPSHLPRRASYLRFPQELPSMRQ
jgi:hypothetical protein